MIRAALVALLVSGFASAAPLTVDDVLAKKYPPAIEQCRKIDFWADRDECIKKAAPSLPKVSKAEQKACKKIDTSDYLSGDLPGLADLLCPIRPAE